MSLLMTSNIKPTSLILTNAATAAKKGESSFTNFLGLFCFGDAGITAAMRNGGITKVHHIDRKNVSFLCFVNTIVTVVYGE